MDSHLARLDGLITGMSSVSSPRLLALPELFGEVVWECGAVRARAAPVCAGSSHAVVTMLATSRLEGVVVHGKSRDSGER